MNGFKKFIMRGNVIDMAVGVLIGGAFSKIVSSLVQDILTPVLSIFNTNKIGLENLFLVIGSSENFSTLEEAKNAGAITLNYGLFLQNIIDFLVIALVIYIITTQINKLMDKLIRKPEEEPAPKVNDMKECMYCLTEVKKEAKRCPHCTSILVNDDEGNSDEDTSNENEEENKTPLK